MTSYRTIPTSAAIAVSVAALVLSACSSSSSSVASAPTSAPSSAGSGSNGAGSTTAVTCHSPSGATGPGTGTSTVGFIYVGSKSDYGYNQAAHDGAVALGKACTNLKILEADSIPETADMTRIAEDMIAKGSKIIFSTSYGYRDYAVSLAKKHPDVVVLQQGNLITPPVPPNANTYFGNVYETVYMAGIAAAKATKSNKLGFVAAFPIPQTLVNIDAFELGAQSVNPAVQTLTDFTGSWCDPAKQSDAANSLLGQGVDVLTQHQDCTGTVIKTAEAKGAFSVGYHHDAEALAPKGWLTGSQWNWGPLYEAMVSNILDGQFTGGPFNTNYTLGFSSTTIPSPMVLSNFGPSVSTDTKALVDAAKQKVLGGWSPFTGPITDQAGKVEVPAGQTASAADLSKLSYLVKGVVGTLPSS